MPEVMDAIYYGGGIIRPAVAVVKSLASAVAIGSGSAVGREGPIIQIGSALGSTLGQIRMPPGQRIILVAAGAGAGIAATFNTPIGGVMFTIELMMPEVSVSSFLPVALATGTSRPLSGACSSVCSPPSRCRTSAPLSNDFASADDAGSLRGARPSRELPRPRSCAACTLPRTCSTRSGIAICVMSWACCWSAC